MIYIKGFRLTWHAAERMVEMGLTASDLEQVLDGFENRYEQSRYGEGRFVYQRGGLAVGTAERAGDKPVIVTVLWNRKEQWDR